jgi:hypothetical protein
MAKKAYLDDQTQVIISDVWNQNKDCLVKDIHLRVNQRLTARKLREISLSKVAAVVAALNKKEKASKTASSGRGIDSPWNFGCMWEGRSGVSREAMRMILQIYRKRLDAYSQKGDASSSLFSLLTVRQAGWINLLYPVLSNLIKEENELINLLWVWAASYSRQQQAFELAGMPFDTFHLDYALLKGNGKYPKSLEEWVK